MLFTPILIRISWKKKLVLGEKKSHDKLKAFDDDDDF